MKTATKTTNPKITKPSSRRTKMMGAVKITYKETEAQEKAAPKILGIVNGGATKATEAVSVMFSIAKTWLDDGKPTPEIGGLILVETKKHETVPMLVRNVVEKTNGELFVQSFLCEKGSQHHLILGGAHDREELVNVYWM